MILAVLLLGLVLRLILINQSLWLDEAAQVMESQRPLLEQFKIAGDFQPPLFHLLLHFWMKLGSSEIWMRLLTVVISVFGIYLFYQIGRKLLKEKSALLASFLLAINPFAIYYSQELRPYPLTVLVSLIMVLGFINSSSFLFILGTTFFLYTSYFAPFFIIAFFLYLIIFQKNKLNWFLKNMFIAILFFLPWLPSFYQQFTIGTSLTTTLPGWGNAVSLPLLKAIPVTFFKFFLGRITIDNKLIYALVVFVLISLLVYLLIRARKEKHFFFVFFLFLIPFLLSFLTSIFVPVIEPKRLLFILPFFILLLVMGLKKLSRFYFLSLLLILIITFSCGLFLYFVNPRFQRENWRQAVSFVEENSIPNTIVLFSFPEPFAPYLWYQKDKVEAYGVSKNFVVNTADLTRIEPLLQERQRIYYFQYLSELTDPDSKITKLLEENGFSNTKTYDFPGVGFVFQYDKTPMALAS